MSAQYREYEVIFGRINSYQCLESPIESNELKIHLTFKMNLSVYKFQDLSLYPIPINKPHY